MNVWKDENKKVIAEWTDPEKCAIEVIDVIRKKFAVDEIDLESFYRVPNTCGGTDGYLVLPLGGQVCLVECKGGGYKATLYHLSTSSLENNRE